MKLAVLLLLLLCTSMPIQSWFVGDGGLTLWDHGCWWSGTPMFEGIPALAEQCGGVCIANRACRFFNWQSGYCHLYTDAFLVDGNGKEWSLLT